ncbi:MAG TPA: DUF4276 family protein [Bryobacteraceae bacterium]|nr:DUF4276 family protein [Bryobacteraceae bacterium]
MPFKIAPIVEGHGEYESVPLLFRRVIAQLNLAVPIEIVRPIRRARGTLLKERGIEAAVCLAAIEIGEEGAVFILLDSEGDCPAELAIKLLRRVRNARPDKKSSVVLAHHEFEAWFLASASSLKGLHWLNDEVEDHPSPEEVQDCKGWIERWMPIGRKYSETADQPAFTTQFDFVLARNARSFRKFWKELESVCQAAKAALE